MHMDFMGKIPSEAPSKPAKYGSHLNALRVN